MINRNVDLNDLSKFDFFNDTKDTAGWLEKVGRHDDAAKLMEIARHRIARILCHDLRYNGGRGISKT